MSNYDVKVTSIGSMKVLDSHPAPSILFWTAEVYRNGMRVAYLTGKSEEVVTLAAADAIAAYQSHEPSPQAR